MASFLKMLYLLLSRFQAEDPEWSTWKAEFALVYIHPVNGLLKRAIEKGKLLLIAKSHQCGTVHTLFRF